MATKKEKEFLEIIMTLHEKADLTVMQQSKRKFAFHYVFTTNKNWSVSKPILF
jgi:hypothetical protein